MRRVGLWRRTAGAFAVLLLTAGCGGDGQTPAEAVPELSRTLSSIDDALAAHRYGQARDRLTDLVETAVDAREAGELEQQQADRVLSAAARLLSALPPPRRPAAEEPEPSAPAAEPEPGLSEDEREKRKEEREKRREERQKEFEELQKELEKRRKRTTTRTATAAGRGPATDTTVRTGPTTGTGTDLPAEAMH